MSTNNDKKGWDWRKEFEKYFNRRHSQMTHLNDRQGKKDCEVCKEDREKNPKGYYLTYLSEQKFYWNRGMYEDVVAFISKLVEEVEASAYERGVGNEIVICAAVKATTGKVVLGHRHNNAIATLRDMGLELDRSSHDMQGFITSKNRYVTRKEGLEIQLKAGIPSVDKGGYKSELYSEDLY